MPTDRGRGDGPRHAAARGVFVVDPHDITRIGTCKLVEGDTALRVIGSTGSLDDVVATLAASDDVSLIVVEPLAAPNGEEDLFDTLAEAAGGVPVLALSARAEASYVARLLTAGAFGFVSKSQRGPRILTAMKEVLAGRTVVIGALDGR